MDVRQWAVLLATLLPVAGCRGDGKSADTLPDRESAPPVDSQDSDPETGRPDETGDSAETGDSGDSGDSGEPGEPDGLPALLQLHATPRNLLIISVDTLRRDAVGALTGGDDTPTLDALMSEAVVLSAHRACSSWTYPGIVCAMTGAPAETLGFVPFVPEYTEDVVTLPEEVETLASILAAEGLQTALVAANGYLGDGTGMSKGFGVEWVKSGVKAEAVNEEALTLIDGSLDLSQPWMLHLHYIDPHSPYAPPDEYLGALDDLPPTSFDLSTEEGTMVATNAYAGLSAEDQAILLSHFQARYAAEVRYVDAQIGLALAELDSRGMLDDTLLMFWADHGEQLFEHGSRGHAASLFGNENDGVAFFWSRQLDPATWGGLTSNEDMPLSALAMLGFSPSPQMTGKVAGARGAEEPVFGTLIPRGRPPMQTVMVGDTKMLYAWDGRKDLYQRDTDPDETTDVYDSATPEVEKLWELLLPKVTELDALTDTWTPSSVGP